MGVKFHSVNLLKTFLKLQAVGVNAVNLLDQINLNCSQSVLINGKKLYALPYQYIPFFVTIIRLYNRAYNKLPCSLSMCKTSRLITDITTAGISIQIRLRNVFKTMKIAKPAPYLEWNVYFKKGAVVRHIRFEIHRLGALPET